MSYLEILQNISYLVVKGNMEQQFIGKIRIDSKIIKQGDIFVALPGNKVDGHDFINSAIQLGAKCIICEKNIETPQDIIVIKVLNTRTTLLELAKLIRKKYINIPLIAVTGSVGKTTTKELIYQVLSTKYKVLKSKGNNNNTIGVPLTLFELDDNYDIIVLELGMNHIGEISTLSNVCLPNAAIITIIGSSHIGLLGSKKNIFKAKMEITDGLSNGILIINGDDKFLNKVKSSMYRIVKCGTSNKNDVKAFDILCTDSRVYFKVKILNNTYQVVFPIPNECLVTDILFSIFIGIKYNVPVSLILDSLENYYGIENRNQIIKLNNNITLIDDSYNSSYESLKAGLQMLEQFNIPKIVVIGDILELGEYSVKIHKKVQDLLKDYYRIILVGKEIKCITNKDLIYCDNVQDVIKYLETLDLKGKLIYLKASHAIGLSKVTEYLKNTF